jgi:putative Mn2+ efflux pump MntP
MMRLLLFVLPLGLDTFALSTVLGVTPMPVRTRLRLAATFAAAEGLMPAVGLLIGLPLGRALGDRSTYLAGVLLAGVGAWMLLKERRDDTPHSDTPHSDTPHSDTPHSDTPHSDTLATATAEDKETASIAKAASARWWVVAGLALGVSLDELAVGFSFGVLGFPLLPALGVIALQALVLSLVGQWVGGHAGRALGERAEKLAGPALLLVGVWFVLAQLIGIPF